MRCAWRTTVARSRCSEGSGITAFEQIAVADDGLEGAVDLGRDRQRVIRHRLDRSVLADQHLELLGDAGDRKDLGDRPQRLDMHVAERLFLSRDDVQRADGAPLRDERHQQRRAEAGGVEHVGVEEIRRGLVHVVQDERLSRPDDEADRRALDLEHDFWSGPVAAFVLPNSRGVGLEFLAVFRQQREPGAIARARSG